MLGIISSLFPYLVLISFVLLLYVRTILHSSTGDDPAVLTNPNIGTTYSHWLKGKPWTWHTLRQAIGVFEVRWLSWYTLGFFRVYSIQHGINICIHTTCSLVIWYLFGGSVAVLFAVHPLMTASVCPLSGRFTLLSTMFALLALLAAANGLWFLFIMSWLSALLSKEDFLLLPLLAATMYGWKYSLALLLLIPVWYMFKGYATIQRTALKDRWLYFKQFWLYTLQRVPLWLVGRGLMVSPRTDWQRTLHIPLMMVGLCIVLLTLLFGSGQWMMFFIFGPWMLYSLVQLQHPWMDNRAYFSVLGLALILKPVWWLVAPLYFIYTRWRIQGYRDHLSYWTMAMRDGAEDAPTIFNYGSALMACGFIQEGRKAIQYGLTKDSY